MKFKCPNYVIYRSDRVNKRGGGSAILIRKNLKHNEFLLPHLQHMEATAIQLHINKELIILVFVYNPPVKIIQRDLDLLIGTGRKVILAGDLNAKHITWRARQNNTAGQSLLKHYYKSNYVISAPSQPTHFRDRNSIRADILEIAILSNVRNRAFSVTHRNSYSSLRPI
jgi:hypothetical protein